MSKGIFLFRLRMRGTLPWPPSVPGHRLQGQSRVMLRVDLMFAEERLLVGALVISELLVDVTSSIRDLGRRFDLWGRGLLGGGTAVVLTVVLTDTVTPPTRPVTPTNTRDIHVHS